MVKLLDWALTGITKNGIGREALAVQAAQASVVKADQELDSLTATITTGDDTGDKSQLDVRKAIGKEAASKEVSSEVTGTADGDLAVIKDEQPEPAFDIDQPQDFLVSPTEDTRVVVAQSTAPTKPTFEPTSLSETSSPTLRSEVFATLRSGFGEASENSSDIYDTLDDSGQSILQADASDLIDLADVIADDAAPREFNPEIDIAEVVAAIDARPTDLVEEEPEMPANLESPEAVPLFSADLAPTDEELGMAADLAAAGEELGFGAEPAPIDEELVLAASLAPADEGLGLGAGLTPADEDLGLGARLAPTDEELGLGAGLAPADEEVVTGVDSASTDEELVMGAILASAAEGVDAPFDATSTTSESVRTEIDPVDIVGFAAEIAASVEEMSAEEMLAALPGDLNLPGAVEDAAQLAEEAASLLGEGVMIAALESEPVQFLATQDLTEVAANVEMKIAQFSVEPTSPESVLINDLQAAVLAGVNDAVSELSVFQESVSRIVESARESNAEESPKIEDTIAAPEGPTLGQSSGDAGQVAADAPPVVSLEPSAQNEEAPAAPASKAEDTRTPSEESGETAKPTAEAGKPTAETATPEPAADPDKPRTYETSDGNHVFTDGKDSTQFEDQRLALDETGTITMQAMTPAASGRQAITLLVGQSESDVKGAVALEVAVNGQGGVDVTINTAEGAFVATTPTAFVSPADSFVTHLTWSKEGVEVSFQNQETGVIHVQDLPVAANLSGLNSVKPVAMQGENQGTGVQKLVVYDTVEPFKPNTIEAGGTADGVVDGTGASDLIDIDYRDDPEGDVVTRGNDVIKGNAGDDTIFAYNGDDQIFGGVGADVIDGGSGNDVIEGGDGDDGIIGGTGQDEVFGGNGDDRIDVSGFSSISDEISKTDADKAYGGDGNDTFIAGAGDFVDGGTALKGAPQFNTLEVADGKGVAKVVLNDDGTSGVIQYFNAPNLTFQNIHSITGISSNPNPALDGIVQGTGGADVIDVDYSGDPHGDFVDNSDAILPGDTNNMDVIQAFGGNDSIYAGAEADEVFAGSGDDYAEGNDGEDLMFGEAGNDTMWGDNGSFVAVNQPVVSPDMASTCIIVNPEWDFCYDFDTQREIMTEDVWFAGQTVVTGSNGEIIGDCTITENGGTNTMNVVLDAPVSVDTWVTVTIADGTANQAIDPKEFQSWGSPGVNTQYWWSSQAHYDHASGLSWFQNIDGSLLSAGPSAQGDVTTDTYIGLAELDNDYRVYDTAGTEVTGQTFQVLVPAGSDTSGDFTYEAMFETSINGNAASAHTPGGLPVEGTETFTFQVTDIAGTSTAGPLKTVEISDLAINTWSPVAFDLSGNAEIDVTGSSTAYGHAYTGGQTVSYDIDGDGTVEDIEWLSGATNANGQGDGLLIDTTQIGAGGVTTGAALFGDQGGLYANGYEKMSQLLDGNGDNLLTGSELANLGIWVDDGDAVVEIGEIQTLDQHGITELSTVGTVQNVNGEDLIRSVTLADAEVTNAVTYTITGDDAEFFEIDENTGKLTYLDGFEPDFNNPQDLDGDNEYQVTIIRSGDDLAGPTTEDVAIKIADPCEGADDVLFGGANDDLMYGQGGEDQLTGDAGNDSIYGGCDNDVIVGDNDQIGEDWDPSDGCVTIIDDSPCICIDVDTTKTMVTEDVWFAENTTTTIDGMIVGDCDLVEGHDGTFKVQLDAPVTVDTQVVITINNGTAIQTTGSFEEFTSGVYFQYNNPQVSTYDTQWWFANQTHADDFDASGKYNSPAWSPPPGGSNSPGDTWFNQMYDDPTANNDSTGQGSHSDAYVGAANLTNDFTVKDAAGNVINGNQITVTVPAGSSMSEEFFITANVEAMVHGLPGGYYNANSEGDEAFTLSIDTIGGGQSSSAAKDVNIEDVHINVYSPIAFDLNCNGTIDVTGSSTAQGHAFTPGATTVSFDIDADGTLETIEWMAGTGDGMLVDTDFINFAQINQVGALNGEALFGDQGGAYLNGYDKLDQLHDANDDDVINGTELDGLAIWVDDGDGILETGELETLAENGITELQSTMTLTNVGGEMLMRSETIVDSEATGAVQYSLTGDDAEFFDIHPETGKITYKDGVHLDASDPQDQNLDNNYEVNIIRTGTDFDQPNVEPLTIKVVDEAEGGNDDLYGGLGDDDIEGNGGNDYIEGNEGDDCIDGGFGDDVIYGDDPSLDAGTGAGGSGIPGNVTPILLEKDNVTLQSPTQALYTNVGTHNGQQLNAVLSLSNTSNPDVQYSLAATQNGEITIQAGSLAAAGGSADFKLSFIYASTGQPAEIEAGIVFSDLDQFGTDTGTRETITHEGGQIAEVATLPGTSVIYDFSGGSLKAKGTEDNPNSQFGEGDSQIATVWQSSDTIDFTLHMGKTFADLNFAPMTDEFFDGVAGPGDDKITGGWGNDEIYGGFGNDVIDSSGEDCDTDGLPDIGVPGCNDPDFDPNNDLDVVFGGAGDDIISTGDDSDKVFGGTGNDSISSGTDADYVEGGDGNDKINAGEGSDEIHAGDGNDVVFGDDGENGGCHTQIDCDGDPSTVNDMDLIYGGKGVDHLYGGDDDDTIYGGDDGDRIYGGIDDDTLFGGKGNDGIRGGQGNDTIHGGEGADSLYGGADNDFFTGLTAGDYVYGGTEAHCGNDTTHDCDTLDLSNIQYYDIVDESVDADLNSTSGVVHILDGVGGNVTGKIVFEEIEKIIPCFTPGTMIATPNGEVAVETLKMGDKVLTRDNGMQEIQWMGSKAIDQKDMIADPKLRPVMITAGSLGHGLPEVDLMVSPNHRVLVANAQTELLFEDSEVLVAAKHLVGKPGIYTVDVTRTEYIHFMFDKHEVVLSNGTWTESFQPGEQALNGIDDDQRDELFKLFPELQDQHGRDTFKSARHTLKAYEAKLAI